MIRERSESPPEIRPQSPENPGFSAHLGRGTPIGTSRCRNIIGMQPIR
jgi:hypothetical protein